MKSLSVLSAVFFTGAYFLPLNTLAETHAAHEHGVAQMNMVQSENEVLLEISSPAFNVFGFEHSPHSIQEKKLVEQRIKRLQAGGLITFDTEANCDLEKADIKNPFAKEHEHEHEHGGEHHHVHRDIQIEYKFTCQKPQELKKVDLELLFKNWTLLEQVRTQWVLGNYQSSATATRQQLQVKLK